MQDLNKGRLNGSRMVWKWVFLGFIWLAILSLVRGLGQIQKGLDRIEETKQRLSVLKQENISLTDKLKNVGTREYQEKEIRDTLNMQKPGEVVVVLTDLEKKQGDGNVTEEASSESNWGKWWKLIK